MGLTGLAIFKLLPKTNCKDCGRPTCLAFAMALASKKAELKECPHVSEEARAALESAAAPPIKLVKIGAGDDAFQAGEERFCFATTRNFITRPVLPCESPIPWKKPRSKKNWTG